MKFPLLPMERHKQAIINLHENIGRDSQHAQSAPLQLTPIQQRLRRRQLRNSFDVYCQRVCVSSGGSEPGPMHIRAKKRPVCLAVYG